MRSFDPARMEIAGVTILRHLRLDEKGTEVAWMENKGNRDRRSLVLFRCSSLVVRWFAVQ